jgi:hypothetical protein
MPAKTRKDPAVLAEQWPGCDFGQFKPPHHCGNLEPTARNTNFGALAIQVAYRDKSARISGTTGQQQIPPWVNSFHLRSCGNERTLNHAKFTAVARDWRRPTARSKTMPRDKARQAGGPDGG